MTLIPNYAPPALSGPDRHRLTRAACVCGLIPLIVGIACFLGWAIFGSSLFMVGGIFTIWGGLLLVAAGGICVLNDYILRISRQTPPRHWLPIRRQLIALALLVGNFPAVYAVIACADYISQFYVVIVDNQSSTVVDDLVLDDRDLPSAVHLTHIAPGTQTRTHERISGPFSSYTITQNQHATQAPFVLPPNAYSRKTPPHDMIVVIHTDGSVTESPTPGANARDHLW